MSFAVALQSLITVGVAAVCWAGRSRPRTVLLGSVGAMAVGYMLVLAMLTPEVRHRAKLREAHPLESLSARMDYETGRDPARRAEQVPPLATDVEARLVGFEELREWNPRAHALESLHDRTRDMFVMAQGFGPVRMRGLGSGYIELPEVERVPLPAPPVEYSPDAVPPGPLASAPPPPPAGKLELFTMHDRGVRDLLDPERMGFVRDRDHVAGFQPHAFSRLPALESANSCKGGRPLPWQLVRLELVGLLRHETPVAYVTQHLPRMDELGDAPTRPLEAFERESLDKLRADEDVVIHQQERRIQMLGSLRAARDCLGCHTARRGELLGALSYELVPVGAAPPQEIQPVDPQTRFGAFPDIAQSR
jgi:hypothetical protein